ncbi:Mitochondrial uncoupling protein 4 [Trichoplax sp. H2]|nr:Mitochondrial uncoupling protein 4 [Trichoplax sp. H2]|eukprot:RDD47571.1 Mitochondrial uncoupling protein 4 [Trichoplax sp. H2]
MRPKHPRQDGDSLAFVYVLSIGAATMSELVTFPLDLTKTRLIIQGEGVDKDLAKRQYRGMAKTLASVVKEEGFLSLYKGVTPGILRHVVYSGVRMVTYEYIRENILGKREDGIYPLWKAVISGMTAGAIGQFLANPTDVIKIQMQMEGKRIREGKTPRYRGTFDAFSKLYRSGGIRGLWLGWGPNATRASLVTMGDLTTYDTVKHWLLLKTTLIDNWALHLISSGCSSLVAAVLAMPVDVVKTRIMNQNIVTPKEGQVIYSSVIDCLTKTVKNEGLSALYKGFFPTWLRMCPWSLTFWFTYEEIRKLCGTPSF